MINLHKCFADLISLTKPRITFMALLLAIAGVLQAKHIIWSNNIIWSLIAIGLLVSGSSVLNMYIERDLDKKMERTKNRPLAQGRLSAWLGLYWGCLLSSLSFIIFFITDNYLTLILGIFALFIYIFCYTPLKKISWIALLVGSFPGAMPVVLGYTSISNSIDNKAIVLFLWAYLWQLPHFLAISLFREQEYYNAGFKVLSKSTNAIFAKKILLISSWILVASTLMLYLNDIIGHINTLICLIMGIVFLYICHRGAFQHETYLWAKRAFKASLIYQTFLFMALIVEAL